MHEPVNCRTDSCIFQFNSTVLNLKKNFLMLVISCLYQYSRAQTAATGDCLQFLGTYKYASHLPFDSILQTKSSFILLSEIHYVSVNSAIKFSMIKAGSTNGCSNIILEYPLSYSIICNHLLETGDTSSLSLISASCEDIRFWKNIIEWNRQLPVSKKIKFWGIDFEITGDRRKYFLPAIDILCAGKNIPDSILHLLKMIPTGDESARKKVQQWLANSEARQSLGNSYALFQLLISRNTDFDKNRDKELFASLLEIDALVRKSEPKPRYFASFGIAHVNIQNKRSFASLLLNDKDSPYKNDLFVVATEYVSCTSNYRMMKETRIDLGLLDKKTLKKASGVLPPESNPFVTLVGKSADCKSNELPGDIALIYYNYPGEATKTNCAN